MTQTVTATYRLQFTPDFGFREAIELVPYLDRLGISHIYASPLLKPTPGSLHGYDVTDPTTLNPELGEESEFQDLLAELRGHGMGLILDIVPNHMAVNSENHWWRDVLEHGQRSRFAHFFDIDWERGDGRVVLPTLGDHFGVVLENGELRLSIDERGLSINYYENRFPVDPASYVQVLTHVQEVIDAEGGHWSPELQAILELSRALDLGEGRLEELQRASGGVGRRTWNLYHSSPAVQGAFDRVFSSFNGDDTTSERLDSLERLLDSQRYRLTFWRRASEEINYRRFFDIADLVSLRIEDPDVFNAVHSLVMEYASTDGLDGFRADHVDGLLDPEEYAERLHDQLSKVNGRESDFLLLFEKILTGDERLPGSWPISGTTGYEFAHRLNAVLADPDGFERIERNFAKLTGMDEGFEAVVHANKAKVLDDLFAGQFTMLIDGLYGLAQQKRQSRDLSRRQLADALREIMVQLPVYRTYASSGSIGDQDRKVLSETIEASREMLVGIEEPVWSYLKGVLTPESGGLPPAQMDWVRRWQQFTGPLMAKGLEDTSLYVYTPLASLNEVGGEPDTLSAEDLHAHNQHVAEHWPQNMLTTSTHDTKRSEDVRARIGVLSELADEWIDHLDHWREVNALLRETVNGIAVPDANEEQLIYQSLLGAWPLSRSEFGTFRERIKEYVTKAMREAKIHTSWIAIDEEHEQAVLGFIDRVLDSDPGGTFFRDFVAFQTRIASFGAWNSLSQLVLKLTSPGFPDIYQGNELWDFSLADPDNRRPVDYPERRELLERLEGLQPEVLAELVQQWRDGRIKLAVTHRVLTSRRSMPEPFDAGAYIPLSVHGEHAGNVIAFARRSGDAWAMTVTPIHTTKLVSPDVAPVGGDVWGKTRLSLPEGAPSTWVDVVTGDKLNVSGEDVLNIAEVLRHVPVAVLRSE